MKRTVISLICPIIIGLCFTSCLPEAEETELTSTVALISFSINDLKTRHTITLESGKDSTYTTIMDASSIPFTIDHINGQVYNASPISYGTDVTHVVTKLEADGYVFYYKDGEKTGYSAADSIDFTEPVKFTVVSNDEKFSRDYLITLNVYKTDPYATHWEQIEGAALPAELSTNLKALIKDEQVYLFGQDAEGKYYTTSTSVEDGAQWQSPVEWSGVEGVADASSVTLFEDAFYVLAEGTLYRSENGVQWEATATSGLTCLLAVTSEATPTVWGIKDNTFAYSADMLEWNNYDQNAGNGIDKRIAYFSEALRTNPNIHRTIVIGSAKQSADTCVQVWSKISTEQEWAEVVPMGTNRYGCPNLENLAVISYHGKMYAFGGKSLGNRLVPTEAFDACYESRDNGVTWRVRDYAFSLAKAFEGRDGNFTTVVDAHNRVWMLWGTSGEVWRGTWSGIDIW